jgi:hypothetical protein
MEEVQFKAPPPEPHVVRALRPCFTSSAQENEFEMIVRTVVLNINHCGEDHAFINAKSLAGVTYDVEVIMRCAKADFEAAGGKRL